MAKLVLRTCGTFIIINRHMFQISPQHSLSEVVHTLFKNQKNQETIIRYAEIQNRFVYFIGTVLYTRGIEGNVSRRVQIDARATLIKYLVTYLRKDV